MVNRFGHSAACFLARGMPQGAQPSPRTFNMIVDALHLIVRECQRGCSALSGSQPTGSSGFADDTVLHADGPDAVPVMARMVPLVGDYVTWTGMKVHLGKSGIVAVDMRTGQSVPTDSITLNGKPFPVISPDQPYTHLGVRMTVMGDFSAEKEHVLSDMRKKLAALAEDRVLTRKEKEVVIKIAVCSVFYYSAGLVDWTRSELEDISMMWARAFKRSWDLPQSADGSPFLIGQSDGGRACPSAIGLWIRAVLDVLEQCVSLPGEISDIVVRFLQMQCIVHGCKTLNQLQLLLRMGGRADSLLEHFLLRLDEQGLDISSPWDAMEEESILESLWPKLYGAWLEKERWGGCHELAPDVKEAWDRAQHCLKACKRLGSATPAILTLSQLLGPHGSWLHTEELRQRRCHLSPPEYAALMLWLPSTKPKIDRRPLRMSAPRPDVVESALLEISVSGQCPPCIRGQVVETVGTAQFTLQSLPIGGFPDAAVSAVPDTVLADNLCKSRAIIPLPRSANHSVMVECLTPFRQVFTECPPPAEYVIVRMLDDDEAPLTALHMALVRDCLLGAGRECMMEACSRPQWTVSRDEYYDGCFFPESEKLCVVPGWCLQSGGPAGQRVLHGLVQFIVQNQRSRIQRPAVMVHPWQVDPLLSSKIIIDTSHHCPKLMPSPEGWEVWQRNGRIWISGDSRRVIRIDAAQYGMLLAMFAGRDGQGCPNAQFLHLLRESSQRQQEVDLAHGVSWSRHLMANIQKVTGTDLLIGASAVTYNPHFRYYVSPFPCDIHLGAVPAWPPVPALLVLDLFDHSQRPPLLQQAAAHGQAVWVLRRHCKPDDPDLVLLKSMRAQLIVELPKKSAVLHADGCWEEAAWDVVPSYYATQLWRLAAHPALRADQAEPSPASVRQSMEGKGHLRFSFHWREDPVPLPLQLYRLNQQDAKQYSWEGLVAGTDGSVDLRSERMGAGYVVGTAPVPLMTLSVRVGGPLATTRAEAASLLQLVRDVGKTSGRHIHLLVFVDCLVVLDILRKWGKHDYHPRPREVVHFDVIFLLLNELRLWSGTITLVKVKSHSGCLMNERADELAEQGRREEDPVLCPGPQKYGSFWLRVRPSTRESAETCGKHLPRDSAPNVSLIKQVVAANILRAVKKRSTVFVRDLLHNSSGATVSKVIHRCESSVYRVWLRCMMGIYPVQSYLKRIGRAQSPCCLYCADGTPETFTHFACVCPKFREARTLAHNQVRRVITSFLQRSVGPAWRVVEETRMGQLGLRLRPVAISRIAQALNQNMDLVEQAYDLGRWQPDWVIVSETYKRIAIVDLCRSADVHPNQLSAAGARKQQKYSVLVEALEYYTDQGWVVHVFPWVVGVRGMIDPLPINALLQFLEVPKRLWKSAVEASVLASTRAFYFLHQIRFGSRWGANLSSPADNVWEGDIFGDDSIPRVCGKRGLGTTEERESLGRLQEEVLYEENWKRHRVSPRGAAKHQNENLRRRPTRQGKGRAARAGHPASGPRRNSQMGRDDTNATETLVELQTAESDDGNGENPLGGPHKRKRKRQTDADAAFIYDTDDPCGRELMPLHKVDDEHPEELWSRWRRLAGRRRRHTCRDPVDNAAPFD